MTLPLSNPARTAAVLRELIAEYRAAGEDVISLIDLETAVDKLEANGWSTRGFAPSTPIGVERYPNEPTGRGGL